MKEGLSPCFTSPKSWLISVNSMVVPGMAGVAFGSTLTGFAFAFWISTGCVTPPWAAAVSAKPPEIKQKKNNFFIFGDILLLSDESNGVNQKSFQFSEIF